VFPRLIESSLRESTSDTPVTLVVGPRQAGKSTLVEQFGDRAGFTYRTLDDVTILGAARRDPIGFVEQFRGPTILDEIQRAPELLLPLKRSVDVNRKAGRFILTGSANMLVLPKVSESLAGRMEILTLWPLAQCELERVTPDFIDACFAGEPGRLAVVETSRRALLDRMLRGGFPEVVARHGPATRSRWFAAYLSAMVQRDVRELANVAHLLEVPDLMRTLAARAGSTLNVADLGRALGLPQATTKRYLAMLEALYLVVRIPPWFENFGKRLVRAPKVHLVDSGLLAHLRALDADALAARPHEAGALAEAFVVGELLRLAPHAAARPTLHHLRTSEGLEVDVVLEGRGGQLVGVEAKAGATVGTADFKALTMLRDRLGQRLAAGVVLYAGTTTLPFGDRLWAVPMSALWAGRSPRT